MWTGRHENSREVDSAAELSRSSPRLPADHKPLWNQRSQSQLRISEFSDPVK